jgi:hypothetical protein
VHSSAAKAASLISVNATNMLKQRNLFMIRDPCSLAE